MGPLACQCTTAKQEKEVYAGICTTLLCHRNITGFDLQIQEEWRHIPS